jgi:hypothetical protein
VGRFLVVGADTLQLSGFQRLRGSGQFLLQPGEDARLVHDHAVQFLVLAFQMRERGFNPKQPTGHGFVHDLDYAQKAEKSQALTAAEAGHSTGTY